MLIGNDLFVFKYRLGVNKYIQFLIIFIEIYLSVWILCARTLMTNILEDSTLKKTSVTYLIFRFQLMFFFRILRTRKQLFHISPFRSTCYVLKSFGSLEVGNGVSNWNKVKNLFFVDSILHTCQLQIPVFIYKFMSQCSLWISVSYGFCEFNQFNHFRYANRKYWFHIQINISYFILNRSFLYWIWEFNCVAI